ncbi:MAG: hypothetical protein ACREHD_31295 [Pirellulales bacterium]
MFTLRQEGAGRDDCRQAIARAAKWALTCRNADGGFGHFPGSPSDADANYFQVGTLVMAGWLPPVDPLPPDAHLLSWGMPPREPAASAPSAERERFANSDAMRPRYRKTAPKVKRGKVERNNRSVPIPTPPVAALRERLISQPEALTSWFDLATIGTQASTSSGGSGQRIQCP